MCLSKSRNEDTALRLEACNHHVSPQGTPHDALEVANIGSHSRQYEAVNGRMVRWLAWDWRRLGGDEVVAVVQSADF